MNGLDFFFSPSPTVDTSTGNNGEDDDWGDFVDAFDADRNGADSTPNRIESEKKSQAQWVTSRGPVPLSVFGEDDAEGDESGAPASSFGLSFDSFSSKHNDGTGSVNRVVNSTNHTVGISGLIANLYKENGSNLPGNNHGNLAMNGNDSDRSSRGLNADLSSSNLKFENSAVSFDSLNWNPLKLDTKSSQRASTEVNSTTIGVTLDPNYSDFDKNDDDGWEFKTAESMFQSADRGFKEEPKSGSVMVQNTTDLSSGVWSSTTTNGTGQNFDNGKIDAEKSSFDLVNGDDDLWDNGGWVFKAAEAGEPKKDLKKEESNDWGFGFGFEPVHKTETTTNFPFSIDKELQKTKSDSVSFSKNANEISGETSWAFKQPSLETGNEKQEKDGQTDKPKGALPLSFFEDEEARGSDTLVQEDNLVSSSDIPIKEKAEVPTPSPTVSINDLISSLYSQMEEKNAVHLPEKSDGNINAEIDSYFVNGEEDSWKFQEPKKTITDLSISDDTDDFDGSWEFQGPSPALESDVTEGVNDFDDDSWEFQGPTPPVKDSRFSKEDNGSWEYKCSSVEKEPGIQSAVPNGFGEFHENPVIRIERNDYKEVFHKLKTELCYIALNHLETLKEARDMAAGSSEALEVEIKDLQNCLISDVLMSEIKQETLQPRSSSIAELYTTLQEPKFQALDSEDRLTERLLSAEKDWKSTIEFLKHATLTLKILNLGSHEQQSNYASTWFVIASACAQKLRHAASIWKQVIKHDAQEEILSKPQGKNYAFSVGEIYRVVKILRASTRLYKPWILLAPTSPNVLDVLDECVALWLSSGLRESLFDFNYQGLDHDHFVDQLLDSVKYLDEVDTFMLHTSIGSATSPTCYISGLNSDIVQGTKMVEWNGDHYLLPLANLWANLISREPPSLTGHLFSTVS